MKAEPTKAGILKILTAATTELSDKGVAHYADYEDTHENLISIRDTMFDMVEEGVAIARRVEGRNSGWFFRLA